MSALRIIIVLIELLCFGACVSIGIAAFMFHKSRLMESMPIRLTPKPSSGR